MSQRANPQAHVKELVLHQSVDERTELERDVVECDKAGDETSDEKEVHIDEEEHTDDETVDDEEVHEEEEVHEDEKMHDADDKETDEENTDAEKVDTKKTEEEKKEIPEFLPSSSSLSLSSDYVILEQTIPTPILTPLATPLTTTEAQATVISVPDPSPTVLERLSELEKKLEALSKVDHSEDIEELVQANVINEVKNQLPKFLPKAVSDFVNPRIESTVREVLQKTSAFLASSSSRAAESFSEYELKKILFDKMDKSSSYMTHDKNQELYNALLNSMCLDDAIASGEVNTDKVLRKRHRAEDQDPPTGSKKEKKISRKGKDFEPPKDKVQTGSSKGKTPPKSSKTGKFVIAEESVEEPVHEAAMDVEEPIRDDVVNDVD
ncbi:hypothetical protein Tco_1080203 [Tanacetum coccineum]|uniref:Uncharacterized protein n=1 Tax=Tanacetum coccineum TaxID=301880 RepID=A0ABQ5HVZ4_9ASTR